MTKKQTLEQWLANEEQKQKMILEPDEETSAITPQELITQINQLNLELVQEKTVSQTYFFQTFHFG